MELKIGPQSNLTINEKINYFYENMYLLNTSDRKNLFEDYQDIFKNSENQKLYRDTCIVQTRKMKEVFKEVLLLMKKEKIPNKFQQSFQKKYYIGSAPNCFIPYNEGNEDLIFSYLILTIYNTFCVKKSKPVDIGQRRNFYNKEINNFDETIKNKSKIKGEDKPENNLLIKDSNEEPMEIDDENHLENDDNKNKEKKENDNFVGVQNRIFKEKLDLFTPIIDIYLSDEFEFNRNEFLNNMKNHKFYDRIKYIYEITINLMLYCLTEFPQSVLSKTINKFYDYFYEYRETKKDNLQVLLLSAEAKLFDEFENEIPENEILKNKIYIIKFNKTGKIIKINPYDYVLKFLISDLKQFTYEEIIFKMNDTKNYSLQKCSSNDKLFRTQKTNIEFDKYLHKIMNHKILRQAFEQIQYFSQKQYPLDNQKLVKQIKNNLLFLPFPTPHLSGLTLKKFGFILININRFYKEIDQSDNQILRYIKKLCETGFIIITIIHEVNFHYFLVILFQNHHLVLKTPPIPFKNYAINKKYIIEDGGDMGEILLFGKQVKYFYLNALYKFLTLELWDKYKNKTDLDFLQLGNEFLKENSPNENIIKKYSDFVDINDFTKSLSKEIEIEFSFLTIGENNTFNKDTNLCNYFSKGKVIGEMESEKSLEEIISQLERGDCLTRQTYHDLKMNKLK